MQEWQTCFPLMVHYQRVKVSPKSSTLSVAKVDFGHSYMLLVLVDAEDPHLVSLDRLQTVIYMDQWII